MKYITLLLILCGFIASAQSPSEKQAVPFLGVRSESSNLVGATYQNTNKAEKAGIVFIVDNDTGWIWIDTLTGRFNFYPQLNVTGAWTKSGSNIYPTTITDNVGIGKVPTVDFDLVSKSGSDSITIQISPTSFELIGYGTGTLSIQSDGATIDWDNGEIRIEADNNSTIYLDDGIFINSPNSTIFQSGDVSIETGDLTVSDNITVGDSVTFNGDIFDLADIPSDSTSVGSGKVWVDINGFIRRKF